ncbi:MAG: glycosyltransferase [Bacteroidales bacterium]|nr:glycosyltransferase [Bacteroidales bacterium]
MNVYFFLSVLDWAIFIMIAFSAVYLLIFVLASKFYHPRQYPDSDQLSRILVLFPAYGEDDVILHSVAHFLLQDYPKEQYELVVISDHMQDETNEALQKMPISLFVVTFEQSSKAKALNFAMEHFEKDQFGIVTILDADNLVEPSYLHSVNNACHSGVKALQAHRTAKNHQTEVAVFDAVSEEVNNTIFRKGHCALGLSSALVGSGMAFDFNWFKENVVHLQTAGEDKELETLLLMQSIKIEYLDGLYVMDEKTSKNHVYYRQRQRWLAAQYSTLFSNLKNIPRCIRSGNFNYLNKIIQWSMLPRVVLFGFATFMALILLLFASESSVKWFVLIFLMGIIFVLATPGPLFRLFIRKSWKTVPVMFVMMILNFFKMHKGKIFIHTPHGQE